MKEIFVDIERCTACKACEIACAVEHSTSKELFGAVFERPAPQKRVHVEPAYAYAYPVRCLHCGDARSITAVQTAHGVGVCIGRLDMNPLLWSGPLEHGTEQLFRSGVLDRTGDLTRLACRTPFDIDEDLLHPATRLPSS